MQLSNSDNILSAAVGHDWFLIYSTFRHGISLRTLYRNMVTAELPKSAVVLLVRDEQNKVRSLLRPDSTPNSLPAVVVWGCIDSTSQAE